MTERQNTLIKELESSFNRMNVSNSGSFNLIDTNAITASVGVANTLKAEINAFNIAFDELLIEQTKVAYDSIKEDIESLGLAIGISKDGKSVIIGRNLSDNGMVCGSRFRFDFKASQSIRHTLIAPDSVTQWTTPVVYMTDENSYGFSQARSETFEPLLRDKNFINKITRMTQLNKVAA